MTTAEVWQWCNSCDHPEALSPLTSSTDTSGFNLWSTTPHFTKRRGTDLYLVFITVYFCHFYLTSFCRDERPAANLATNPHLILTLITALFFSSVCVVSGNTAASPRGCSRFGNIFANAEEMWWYHWAPGRLNPQPVFGHSCLLWLLLTQPVLPLSSAESSWTGLHMEKTGTLVCSLLKCFRDLCFIRYGTISETPEWHMDTEGEKQNDAVPECMIWTKKIPRVLLCVTLGAAWTCRNSWLALVD